MLETIKFLLQYCIKFLASLFSINIGFTTLGNLFCIVYILFPILLSVINSLKHQIISEADKDFDTLKSKRRSKK